MVPKINIQIERRARVCNFAWVPDSRFPCFIISSIEIQGGKLGNALFTMYEIHVDKLALVLADGSEKVFPEALASGRANYMLFEALVRDFTGLQKTTGSDHKDSSGRTYEQKAYEDPDLHPRSKDLFRCSSSSTFGANNDGPQIKKFLENDDYASALELCKVKGYNKNDFYVFTNSGSFRTEIPFRYFIIPKETLVAELDSEDPRMISKAKLFSMIKSKVVLV